MNLITFPRLISRPLAGGGGAAPYYERVLATQTASLIQYLRLNETSGATAVDSSPEANNGTYSGLTLANTPGPDGVNVPLFGAGYCSVYSAPFNTDWNGNELSISIWGKVSGVGVWADATVRRLIGFEHNGGTSYVHIDKSATANRLTVSYRGVTALKQVNITTTAPVDWFNITLTVSAVSDFMKVYFNGVQSGATQTGSGGWPGTGALVATQCNIGAYTQVPASPWSGWLAHSAIWKIPLSDAEALALANPL